MSANSGLDVRAFVNILLSRATKNLQMHFNSAVLAPEGFTLQEWRALLNLSKHGECHTRELARLASMDASHVTRAIVPLERKGFVVRTSDASDARRVKLRTTPQADEIVEQVWAKALELDAEVAAHLGPEKMEVLKDALELITQLDLETVSNNEQKAA